MAAIWQGSVGFGLVEIPVMLRSAEEPDDEVSFTQLDKRDLSPVGYRRYNKRTGKEVAWEDIVKGYEVDEDQYVVVTEDELRNARPKLTKSIDIVRFIDREQIDPILYDRPYYLEPRRQGGKAYSLLRETLERTGKVGIAQVVLRTRQHLAAVSPHGPVLVLQLLRYAHEIRNPKDVEVDGGRAKPTAAEVRIAEQLVNGMSGKWDPEEFKDDYRDEVQALVREKAKTGKLRTIREPADGKDTRVIDLMSALKESLARKRPEGRARPARAERSGRKPARAARRPARPTTRRSRSA